MGAQRRRMLPAWTGVVLVAAGFLTFVASFFLLPLYFTACFDPCIAPTPHITTWDFSLNALAQLSVTPVAEAGILVLCYLPLLAAVTVVGCSVGFLVWPHRTLAMWSFRAWLAGSIALGIMLLLVLLLPLLSLIRPNVGFFGMLVGYGLLWAGNRVFLTAHP